MFDDLKIRALNATRPDRADLRFCGFSVNVPGRSLHYRAAEIPLTPKELDLLIFLAQSGARPVTRDEIIYHIWPTDDISDSALSQTVYRLRRTLAKHNPKTEYVRTIPGIGYQFVAPLAQPGRTAGEAELSNEAFHHYRRAIFHLERGTQLEVERAIAFFEAALQFDPAYVPAQVGLARAHALCGSLLFADARSAYCAAKRLAAQALRLEPASGEAYAVMSDVLLFFDRHYQAAESAAQNAIALAPFSAKTRTAAVWVCIARGDGAAALAHLSDALSIDPSSPALTTLLGAALYFSGRFTDARRHFDDALSFDASFTPAQYFDACCLAMCEEYDAAERRLTQLSADQVPWRTAALRGYIAGKRGDASSAERILMQLARANIVSNISRALVFAGCGRLDEAAESLGTALRASEPGLALAAVDPLLARAGANIRVRSVLDEIRKPANEHCSVCRAPLRDARDVYECSYGCAFCATCGHALNGSCIDCGERLARFSDRRAV